MTRSDQYSNVILKNIKHDLINPINAMIGYSELLLESLSNENILFKQDIQSIFDSSHEIFAKLQQLFSDKSNTGDDNLIDIVLNEELHYSIRTPLSSVIGLSELILEDALMLPDIHVKDFQNNVNKINQAGKGLLRLINDFSKYSDLSKNEILEKYYTDLYLKESNIRDLEFNSQVEIPLNTGNILVVEDDISNLELINKILEQLNHSTFTADNGEDALKILKNNTDGIDLILLDLIMPEINGMDLLKKIKENKKTYNIPIIMLSALDEMDTIAECISLGADDFLMKPINKILLNARMNNALEKKYFHDKEIRYQQRIKKEQKKSDSLLLNILPSSIAERLKNGETLIADDFEIATVLFADIKGFTTLSSNMKAKKLVLLLNKIFSKFDELLVKHSLEKIKTIGDNYMLAGGIPKPSKNHAVSVAEMALDMLNIIPEINNQTQNSLEIRIGINSGPVSAGVIGKKKFIYDLWGDTVNIASRMETHGANGRIHISETTYKLLKNIYSFDKCNFLDIAGIGKIQTYYLNPGNI